MAYRFLSLVSDGSVFARLAYKKKRNKSQFSMKTLKQVKCVDVATNLSTSLHFREFDV